MWDTASTTASRPTSSSTGTSFTPYSRIASGALARGSCTIAAIPKLSQLAQDVRHLAVADVVAVFLEGQAQDADAGALDGDVGLDEELDEPLRDVRAHVVVDAPPRQDDLRLVAELLGLHRQVVRVDPDAVAADEPRA